MVRSAKPLDQWNPHSGVCFEFVKFVRVNHVTQIAVIISVCLSSVSAINPNCFKRNETSLVPLSVLCVSTSLNPWPSWKDSGCRVRGLKIYLASQQRNLAFACERFHAHI
jgi:hypothetical protein